MSDFANKLRGYANGGSRRGELRKQLELAADRIELLETSLAVGFHERQNKAEDFLMRKGYRACDIPACNCGSWHKSTNHDENDDRDKNEL